MRRTRRHPMMGDSPRERTGQRNGDLLPPRLYLARVSWATSFLTLPRSQSGLREPCPSKAQARSYGEFFEHVRVLVHEVDRDVEGSDGAPSRLDDHPRLVVFQYGHGSSGSVDLCCDVGEVVLRLREPYGQYGRKGLLSILARIMARYKAIISRSSCNARRMLH